MLAQHSVELGRLHLIRYAGEPIAMHECLELAFDRSEVIAQTLLVRLGGPALGVTLHRFGYPVREGQQRGRLELADQHDLKIMTPHVRLDVAGEIIALAHRASEIVAGHDIAGAP